MRIRHLLAALLLPLGFSYSQTARRELPILRKAESLIGGKESALLTELAAAEAAKDNDLTINVLSRLATSYSRSSEFPKCDASEEQALRLTIVVYGEGSIQHAQQVRHWADLQASRRRYDRVVELLTPIIPIFESKLSLGHADQIDVLKDLAFAQSRISKMTEARASIKHYLEVVLKTFGEESPDYARALSNCSSSLNQALYPKEGEAYAVKAVAILDKIKSPTDDIESALNNLGHSLVAQSRSAEAEAPLRRSYELTAKRCGEDHLAMRSIINNLAVAIDEIAEDSGDHKLAAEAESLYRKSLVITEREFGKIHPLVAVRLGNIASSLQKRGKAKEAEALLRRAVSIEDEMLAPTDTTRNNTRMKWLDCLMQLGRLDEAAALCEETLDLAKKTFGPEHVVVADVLHKRGALLVRLDRPAEAEQSFWEAHNLRKKALGPDHDDVARSLNNVALLCQERGAVKDADSMFRRVVEINRKVHGTASRELALALSNLGDSLRKRKLFAESTASYKESIGVLRTALGAGHADLGEAFLDLAIVQMDAKDSKAASLALAEGVAIQRKALGEGHERTGGLMMWQAINFLDAGEIQAAEKEARNCYLSLIRHERGTRPSDEGLAKVRRFNQSVLQKLGLSRAAIYDRLELMDSGTDPGDPSKAGAR
jgi:tetratricopeptide (TPR) repeat protein